LTRKDFLFDIWKKYLRPILFIFIMFFCVKSLIDLFIKNNFSDFLTVGSIVTILLLIYVSTYFLNLLIKSFGKKVTSKLPDSIKSLFRVINKITTFIQPFIIGALIYHFWYVDKTMAVVLIFIVLSEKISYFIKSERQNEYESNSVK